MTTAEYLSWKQHPHTQNLIKTLLADIENISDAWSNGAYTGENEFITIQLNSKALGQIQAIQDILEYIDNGLEGEEND